MDYLAQNKEAILHRFKGGMSIRRLHQIYGGSPQDIEKLIGSQSMPHPNVGVFAADFRCKGGLTSRSIQLFDALPPKAQTLAFEATNKFAVPVIALFENMGKKHAEKRARGCFFSAVERQCGWSFRHISIQTGWSRAYVVSAISTYLGPGEDD